VTLVDHAEQALSTLQQQGLRRRARDVDGPQGPRLVVDGRSVLCMCSNNYLGLAGHPDLSAATQSALAVHGVGSGASRLISGSMAAHRAAEHTLASFVRATAAALFSSGYACNVGVLQALFGKDDVIFSDSLIHASLIDGARLSRARVVVYAHADAADLERKLRQHRHEGRLAVVLTESLYSMDGDVPPLLDLARLARSHDAAFLVDEAHALGIYGPQGRGLCAALGLVPDVLIGTLGKALGGHGAFVAAAEPIIDLIRNRARSYIFSTAPAPALAGAAVAAVGLVQASDPARAQLRKNVAALRSGLSGLGFRVLPGTSPIIPVMVGESDATMALSRAVLDHGVFAHGIRPPTVPPGSGRLRVVPMATHSDADIAEALAAFARVGAP
jgi:8-amino-7-oxononanoate synthase